MSAGEHSIQNGGGNSASAFSSVCDDVRNARCHYEFFRFDDINKSHGSADYQSGAYFFSRYKLVQSYQCSRGISDCVYQRSVREQFGCFFNGNDCAGNSAFLCFFGNIGV